MHVEEEAMTPPVPSSRSSSAIPTRAGVPPGQAPNGVGIPSGPGHALQPGGSDTELDGEFETEQEPAAPIMSPVDPYTYQEEPRQSP